MAAYVRMLVRLIEYSFYYFVTLWASLAAYKWCGYYFVSEGEVKLVPSNIILIFFIFTGASICGSGLGLLGQDNRRFKFLLPPFAIGATALACVSVFLLAGMIQFK